MSLRNTLNRLMRVVLEEAERNPDFEATLSEALGIEPKRKPVKGGVVKEQADDGDGKRGKNRRAPAALDPVQVVRGGEQVLRGALEKFSLDQLRDIVAEYGMDPGRLVMKWVAKERIIDRIVEMSITRAHKGSAFRKPADEPQDSLVQAKAGPLDLFLDEEQKVTGEGGLRGSDDALSSATKNPSVVDNSKEK